jgi:hypothetical protein
MFKNEKLFINAAISAIVIILSSLVMLFISSVMTSSETISPNDYKGVAIVASFVGGIVGAVFFRIKSGNGGKLIGCMLSALFALILRLLISMMIGGKITFDSLDLYIIISIFIGTVITGAVNKSKRKKFRR